MKTSAISVIIPALNAARYLREAVESIRAQTLQPAEIIVVDNGSTDGTPALVAELGLRCEHEPQRGVAWARNRGLTMARGDFLALLDQDDLWMPRKLEWQMEALHADPRLEAVFGRIEHFLSPDLPPAEAARIHCPADAADARLPSLLLMRREAFGRVGPFSTDVFMGDIVEWIIRAESCGLRYASVPHVLVRRRLHASNMGRLMRDRRGDYLRVIKHKLDRERLAAQARGKTSPAE